MGWWWFSSTIVTMMQSASVISKPTVHMPNETTPNARDFATPRNAPYIQHATLTDEANSIGTLLPVRIFTTAYRRIVCVEINQIMINNVFAHSFGFATYWSKPLIIMPRPIIINPESHSCQSAERITFTPEALRPPRNRI